MQSLSRAFALLGLVAASDEPIGVSEIARRADLAKTTTARLLNALADLGALEKAPDAAFRIGPTIGALVTGPSGSNDLLRQLAWPHLGLLADTIGEHAVLAVADGGDVLYVAQASSPSAVDPGDWTDTRHPPHVSACGHVLMSGWPRKRARRYMSSGLSAITDQTVLDPDELRARLDSVDESGLAWCVNEAAEDVSSVAAPVVDGDDNIIAAIGVFAPTYRFPGDLGRAEINRLITESAAELSGSFAIPRALD